MTGDMACAEGALAAGCLFFGGYPITPATEIAEHMAARLPGVGGTFIQMEDEIAAMASVLGASWAGQKEHDRHIRAGIQPDDGKYRAWASAPKLPAFWSMSSAAAPPPACPPWAPRPT